MSLSRKSFTYWLCAMLALPVSLVALIWGTFVLCVLIGPVCVIAIFSDPKHIKPLGSWLAYCVRVAVKGRL